jgi:hypothetical protein
MLFGIGRKKELPPEVEAMEREADYLRREIETLHRRKMEIEIALAGHGVKGFFRSEGSNHLNGGMVATSLSVLLLIVLATSGCATGGRGGDLIAPGSPEWDEPYIAPPLERPARQRNMFSSITDNLPTRSINDVERAYQRGESDELKRLYFARNNMERAKAKDHGTMVYYTFPGPTETADGVRLVPHEITVPILE